MSRPTLPVLLGALALVSAWWLLVERGPLEAGGGPEPWPLVQDGDHTGSLGGRVLLDTPLPAEELVAVLECQVTHMNLTLRLSRPVAQDGTFHFDGLPAARARVRLGLPDQGGRGERTLLVLTDLTVPAIGPCGDPRLEAIDLRGRVHPFQFEVLDYRGEPVEEFAIGWRAAEASVPPHRPDRSDAPGTPGAQVPGAGEPTYGRWRGGRNGSALLVCDADLVDILVLAPGAETAELTGVGRGCTVHLRQGWPVDLALPRPARPEDPPLAVRLRPTTGDPRIADPGGERIRFLTLPSPVQLVEGEARVVVARPGTYEVEWLAPAPDPRTGLRGDQPGDGGRPWPGPWRELEPAGPRPRIQVDPRGAGSGIPRPAFPQAALDRWVAGG